MAEEYKTSMSTSGIIIEPTDKDMDNLARQGRREVPNRHTSQWKSTLGKHVRDKLPNRNLRLANMSGTKFILICIVLLTHKTISTASYRPTSYRHPTDPQNDIKGKGNC